MAGFSQDYVYAGETRNAELRLSRLMYRDQRRKTTVWLRGFRRASNNFIDDTEIEVQRRVVAGWELGANHREFIGPATLDANLQYRRGTGAFGAIPAPEELFGEGSSRFRLIAADANLNLPFQIGTANGVLGAGIRSDGSLDVIGDDKNPTSDRRLNPDGEMLGRDGTSTPSTTLYNRAGARIDVENPNPGQRPGQIHLQIGGDKYYFNVNTLEFEGLGANQGAVPRSVSRLLQDPGVQRAINNGLRYLGEVPIKF